MPLICVVRTRPRLIRRVGILGLVATATLMGLAAPSPMPVPGNCPKILMFDGLEIQTQNNEQMAQYWGQKIGVDGFFVDNVMSGWDNSVGDDESSPIYQKVKGFQKLYSKYGVTDNFIKVAVYKAHDWRNAADQKRVIANFHQAAHLAKYAGMKGLALDLEPYIRDYWNEDPAIPDKPQRLLALGRGIGGAIISEFPDATIIVLQEFLIYEVPSYHNAAGRKAYALCSYFWDGFVQAHFKRLIIATEDSSYNGARPDSVATRVQDTYRSNLLRNGVDPSSVSVGLGIWPLAKTRTDKSARIPAAKFEEWLRLALQQQSPYVWIYGQGSGWQKDGPFAKGDVDPHFEDYVQVIHRIKKSCSGG